MHVKSQVIGIQSTLTLTQTLVAYIHTSHHHHHKHHTNMHISSEHSYMPSQLDITHLSSVNVVLVFNASAIARPPSAPNSLLYKLQLHRYQLYINIYDGMIYITYPLSTCHITVNNDRHAVHSQSVVIYVRTPHHRHDHHKHHTNMQIIEISS